MKISELINELTMAMENVGDSDVEIHNGCNVVGVEWNGITGKVQLDNDCYCGYVI